VTRIAIVAASEKLRTALATALGADPAFEIVTVSASVDDVAPSAEVVLVARTSTVSSRTVRRTPGDGLGETVLTNREREILALLAEGLGNKQIGGRLGISPSTVKTHLELLFEKLGVSSRAEAVAAGVRRGLLLL
jgi:DNA-binding NarL/FixJ family response regulator